MNPLARASLLLAQSASEPLATLLARGIVGSLIYSVVGLVLFLVAFFVINRAVPFSLRKVIEEDQNPAIGIVLASVFIGISLILSAAIHS